MAATPASMLRIVTTGLQDTERLNAPIGQPSVHFYSAVFKRRTRWATRWERVDFDNLADFGRRATVTLPVKGELITRATLVVELPDLYATQLQAQKYIESMSTPENTYSLIGPFWDWTNSIGHAICSDVDFQIGNQVIDRLDSRLLEVLDEQEAPVEHFDSTNKLIYRNPSSYSQYAIPQDYTTGQITSRTLEIVFPFWWNRGPGPQALPIQALARDKVQINVNFRPIQECVYTGSRVDPRNLGKEATEPGPMPTMAGCGFYYSDDASPDTIYNIVANRFPVTDLGGGGIDFFPKGRVVENFNMPTDWHFQDAYWIVEYVSLEDREAAAFRMADLQIPITQHVAVPVTNTNGVDRLRIPLPQGGLVRDMSWVAQRVEATDYNAYFLFSRDLAPPVLPGYNNQEPTDIPWWPDAMIPNWDYGDGYVRPAFSTRNSDPLQSATLWMRGLRRFDMDGPSYFRSVIPTMNCQRTPLVNRYIYRYDFGFWPTGGLAETLTMPVDEVRGFSNWDKIPKKELELLLNTDICLATGWETDSSYDAQTITASIPNTTTRMFLDTVYPPTVEGFRISLQGAKPGVNGGNGGLVEGIIDYQSLRRMFGSNGRVVVRATAGGSASLAIQQPAGLTFQYTWLMVAGGGGFGMSGFPGGAGANAISVGVRGDTQQTHEASATGDYGGAGGGRYGAYGVGKGITDGIDMPTTHAFFMSTQRTGGGYGVPGQVEGGDGYGGGGSGVQSGGGGGSWVSRYITGTNSDDNSNDGPTTITITPVKRIQTSSPHFNIYIWLTTVNMLRITGGRGGLMFT